MKKVFAKACLVAVFITMSASAMAVVGPGSRSNKENVNLSTVDLALNHYIAVTTKGESAGVEQLFARDFSQKIQASNVSTYGRHVVIQFFKNQHGEVLNCKSNIKIVEKSTDYMVAKISLKFENFSMTDLVTFVYDHDGWKVYQSVHSYM